MPDGAVGADVAPPHHASASPSAPVAVSALTANNSGITDINKCDGWGAARHGDGPCKFLLASNIGDGRECQGAPPPAGAGRRP